MDISLQNILKFISVIACKGPTYRFPNHIDFNKCREGTVSALNDSGNQQCEREHVELNA